MIRASIYLRTKRRIRIFRYRKVFYHGNSMKVFLFGSSDDGGSERKAIIMFHGKLVNNDTVCTCTRVLSTRKKVVFNEMALPH